MVLPEPVSPTMAVVVPAGTASVTPSMVRRSRRRSGSDVLEGDLAAERRPVERDRVAALRDLDGQVEVLEDPVEQGERRLHVDLHVDSSDMIGRKRRVWSVVNATTVPIVTADPIQDWPANQYTAAGITAKLVPIDAITHRPAIRWRTSSSARRSDSDSKRSARASERPIVLPSRIPETDRDSCTMLDMSAIVSWRVVVMRRRCAPTRRVRSTKNGRRPREKMASRQSRKNIAIDARDARWSRWRRSTWPWR